MAGVVTTRLLEALAEIGVDVSKKQPSNVKTLATKNKSSATKPGLLAGERDTGGNFGTVLDIFKKEAQYIDGMNDVEQMAFLNNIMDYKEFGGKSIKVSEGMKLKDEFDKGLGTLKDDIESLQSTAKTMKDDAEKGVADAYKDLDDFFETGGQPLKKKDDRFLGGSMHEEGQLRTAIREFLKQEYKNGRVKLDKDDQFRVMEYSPMLEDDPIKVFKKIYGDEAYNKAGTFPGAFEIGENFTHYKTIFEEKMGSDLLKVKDKKYVGDGTLVLTKREEVIEPTPDDDDMPFAKGGRASFAGGKVVDELVAMIVKKEPIDAMKEVNKIIGKKGKYKNLTQEDIDRIVEGTEDWIFQRDPDNLYVDKRFFKDVEIKDPTFDETLPFDNDAEKLAEIKMSNEAYDMEKARGTEPKLTNNADDMSLEKSLTTLEGLGATKMAERFKLKQKYPGLDDDLLTNIIEDTDPVHKASVLAKIDMAMELGKTNKSADEIIDILKKEPETKMAAGGRAGYYGGGMTNMIEPDLSDIGHGSDALMARTRITAPGSQATTSTGLNYLLGEDNDNIRVPFGGGGTMGASDKGYQGGGRDKKGSVSGTAPGAAPVGGGSEDRGNPQQNLNHLVAMHNYQNPSPQDSKINNLINTGQEANYFYNLYKGSPQGVALSIFGKKFGEPALKKYGQPLLDKLKNLRSEAEIEEDGIMQMAELNDLQKKMLSGPQKQLKDIMGISNEEILQNISPFNTEETPATIEDVNKFYAAKGGIAGLRQGYNKGNIVDKGRRGFLKFLGGTTAGVIALKTGLAKMFGKESGAISKKAIDEVIIEGGSGAPAWLQPLVNKALREGKDISKNAIVDGQVVKSLDTPTGKVDVYYNTRTGEVDIDYIGGNTALGEGVQLRYTPGVADEGTKGVKPADEFEAVESIPEGKAYGPDDYEIEMGENVTDNVGNLFSDTTELAELGGQKTLTKDIVETVKRKKILKQMENDPSDFVTDTQGDFVQFDDINPDPN